MLDAALLFFQEALNNYIKIRTGGQKENAVQFAEIQPPRDIVMQNNAVTMLLVNIEEERIFRAGAAQVNRLGNRADQAAISNLCLNFHLLFIANFKEYVEGLKILSLVLKFFRSYRLFDQHRFPALDTEIQQLSTELVNLTFMEQSELWRSLEMPCSPSAFYKVRMLVFQETEVDEVEIGAELGLIQTVTSQI
ncbi:MAG: DUF4255 domain-containing protein [Leptolyngbya sp. SIO4C5]|nr:DUF4255 domain-containing protein [Leptolyngbya sp. SIO4C5]